MAFFSDTSLRLAGWWVQNRRKLREGRTVLFLAVVFLILVLDGVQVALLAIGDRPLAFAIRNRVERSAEASTVEAPLPITVTTPVQLPAGQSHLDLMAWLHNPNPTWLAEQVSAHFTVGGQSALGLTSFILPGGDRLLLEQGVLLPAGAVQLVIDSVRWQRIPVHDPNLGNVPFTITASTLSATTLSGGTPGTTASFTLRNQSVYGYRRIDITVALERAGSILAVSRTSAVNVRSGTNTPLAVTWAQTFPLDARIRVDAVASPFNTGNRLPPGA